MKVRVRTPSRLHITLIDLNGSIGRVDGGVGIALEEPHMEVAGIKSEKLCIAEEKFRNVAIKLQKHFRFAVDLEILSSYRQHVGLGSGTQIGLAVATVYAALAGKKMSINELASLVGRGGTSGIGVAAFGYGGFIVDGGHSTKVKSSFLPSSASKAPPPPVIARHDFPDWKIVIAVPEFSGAYGSAEVDLFSKNCPIPLEEVRELSHIILMQMLPAVVEEDLDAFCRALNRIQRIGFKRIEVERYDIIKNLLDAIDCAGMSSTGPAVFAITDTDARSVSREIEGFFSDAGFGCETIITRARNRGAEVELL